MNDLFAKFLDCITEEYTHTKKHGSYAVRRDGDKLMLFFEKSNGIADWWNNFNFPAKPYRDMEDLWFCHKGFLKVWKSIEPYIKDDICDPSVSQIEIVGYSHGGAIAQLCYEYVKFNRPDVKVMGIGFGSPCVLWGFPCKAVKERFEDFIVIRNGNDLVTHLPPTFLGFRHVCEVVKIGEREGPIKDHYFENYCKALWR